MNYIKDEELEHIFWGGSMALVALIRNAQGKKYVRKIELGDPKREDVKLVREIKFIRSLPDEIKPYLKNRRSGVYFFGMRNSAA